MSGPAMTPSKREVRAASENRLVRVSLAYSGRWVMKLYAFGQPPAGFFFIVAFFTADANVSPSILNISGEGPGLAGFWGLAGFLGMRRDCITMGGNEA